MARCAPVTAGMAEGDEAQKEAMSKLRDRMLRWHARKVKSVGVVDLLESFYQGFRHRVSRAEGRDLDLREAIKLATEDELTRLDIYITEERLRI